MWTPQFEGTGLLELSQLTLTELHNTYFDDACLAPLTRRANLRAKERRQRKVSMVIAVT